MSTFLTEDELVELTGAKRKSNQIRWLTQHRYPHETNANGAPKVLRCYLERRLGDIQPDGLYVQQKKTGKKQVFEITPDMYKPLQC